jgi:hypothetical protein
MRYASKLCQAEPGQMLKQLVHPSVFELLEISSPLPLPERNETDDVLALTYRGKSGHLLLRNDGVRVLIEGFFGDRPVLRCALRDRQLDGTEQGSPLTFFPNTDPACNRLPAEGFLAAELSIYSWDPNTYLAGLEVEGTVGHFVADPDFYVWKEFEPKTFMSLWEQVFYLGRAPWQTARPMSGVATFFVKQSTAFLKELGYHRVDAVPSWFNVARFFKKIGFQFTYGEHEQAFEAIVRGLKRFPSLDHSQQSWLVALQNLPEAYIPSDLKLPARWPVTHTNMYWVRMHLDLNQFARPAIPQSKLSEKISKLKVCNHEIEPPVLHSSANCPCTTTLGASSPAATGPSATSPLQPEQDHSPDSARGS